MMPPSLDTLSLSFAEALFGRYPELRRHAREETRPDREGAFLVVEVPPPAGAGHDHSLWINTDGEITIGFAEWHGHWPWPHDPADIWRDPLDAVAGILDETYVIEAASEERCLLWSSLVRFAPGQDVEPSPGRILEVEVTSWRGRRNRRYQIYTP